MILLKNWSLCIKQQSQQQPIKKGINKQQSLAHQLKKGIKQQLLAHQLKSIIKQSLARQLKKGIEQNERKNWCVG